MNEPVSPSPAGRVAHATGSEKLKGHLAMVLFAALIAGSFTLGKLVVPYIDPEPLNAPRFMLAALLMGFMAFGVRKHPLRFPRAPWRFAILGALSAIYFVTMFIALELTTPVSTSAVFTLVPLMIAVVAVPILGQTVSPSVALSLFFGAAGAIWVIFGGDIGAIAAFRIGTGELVFFGGCLGYAIYAPLVRKFNHGEPLTVLTFFTLAATAVWMSLYGVAPILATDWAALPPLVWWVLAYLAIFPSAIAFFLVQYSTARMPSSKVIAYGYLTPLFVIVYEGLLGHGWTDISVLGGALVTCLGLLTLYFAREH